MIACPPLFFCANEVALFPIEDFLLCLWLSCMRCKPMSIPSFCFGSLFSSSPILSPVIIHPRGFCMNCFFVEFSLPMDCILS